MAIRKLTDEQVADIKKRVFKTDSLSSLAKEYGVDRKTIYNNISEEYRIANVVRALKYKNSSTAKYTKPKVHKPYKSEIRKDLIKSSNSMYKEILNKQNPNKKDLPISILFKHRMKNYEKRV